MDSGCTETRTFFRVESDAPADKIALLVRNAKQGCHAERTIRSAAPLKSEAGPNGAPLRLEGMTK